MSSLLFAVPSRSHRVMWCAVAIAATSVGTCLGLKADQASLLSGFFFGWLPVVKSWYASVGCTLPFLATVPPLMLAWGLYGEEYDTIDVANELSVGLGTLGTVVGMVGALRALNGISGLDGLLALVPSFCNALVSTGVGLVPFMLGLLLRRLAGIRRVPNSEEQGG